MLRNRSNTPLYVDGKNAMPKLNAVLARIKIFTHNLGDRTWKGHTGKVINTVVNISNGGYSLWLAIGTPITLSLGFDNWTEMHANAHAMDRDFLNANTRDNPP